MNPGAVHLEKANGSGEPTWTKERKWIKKRKWTREVVDQREDVMSPNSPNLKQQPSRGRRVGKQGLECICSDQVNLGGRIFVLGPAFWTFLQAENAFSKESGEGSEGSRGSSVVEMVAEFSSLLLFLIRFINFIFLFLFYSVLQVTTISIANT